MNNLHNLATGGRGGDGRGEFGGAYDNMSKKEMAKQLQENIVRMDELAANWKTAQLELANQK